MRVTDVKGIGKSTAERLAEHGFRTVEDLAHRAVGLLTAVPGFGLRRAMLVRESAAALLRTARSPGDEPTADKGEKPPVTPVRASDSKAEKAGAEPVKKAKAEKKAKAKKKGTSGQKGKAKKRTKSDKKTKSKKKTKPKKKGKSDKRTKSGKKAKSKKKGKKGS